MQDTFGREITYMRISVTEACNMACRYCSPGGADGKEGRRQLLSTDQIVDVCRAAISLGIRNFRFTGGEPFCGRTCKRSFGEYMKFRGSGN